MITGHNAQAHNKARRGIYDILLSARAPLSCNEVARVAGKSASAARWLLKGMAADGVVCAVGRRHSRDYFFSLTGKPLPAMAEQTPQSVLRAQPGRHSHCALAAALGDCLHPPLPRGPATFHFLR